MQKILPSENLQMLQVTSMKSGGFSAQHFQYDSDSTILPLLKNFYVCDY